MRRRNLWAWAWIMAVAVSGLLQAQPGRPGSFGDSVPGVGERLPDLTLIDAEGKAVELHDLLRGHYTVVVLGCLT